MYLEVWENNNQIFNIIVEILEMPATDNRFKVLAEYKASKIFMIGFMGKYFTFIIFVAIYSID